MLASDTELENMVVRLDAMAVKFHALPDGKGIYLGDGHPYPEGQELRSVPLASALRELLAWRQRFSRGCPCDQAAGNACGSPDASSAPQRQGQRGQAFARP